MRSSIDIRNSSELVRSTRRQFELLQPGLALALALAGVLPPYTGSALRVAALRAAGVQIGPGTGIAGRLWVAGGARSAGRLQIGNDCFVNDGCRFDVSAQVTIGDRVFFGHDAAVLTSTHEIGDASRRAGRTMAAPVTIGSGSWIGARAVVLGGLTIGEGSVVAAGAVVIRSVPPDTLVGGVPAVPIRALDASGVRQLEQQFHEV